MTPGLRLALRLAAWACRPDRLEEIEGDLLELHARRITTRGRADADRAVLWEALRAAVGRPADALLRGSRCVGLFLSGAGAAIAYAVLMGSAEPDRIGWPLVIVGTTLELVFWVLLWSSWNRKRVQRR